MPTSKKRKKPSGNPARSSQAVSMAPATLESATLALTQASLEIVREAEVVVQHAVREGDRDKLDHALDVHLELRAAALGLLSAYSKLSGLPDPRESAVVKAA